MDKNLFDLPIEDLNDEQLIEVKKRIKQSVERMRKARGEKKDDK